MDLVMFSGSTTGGGSAVRHVSDHRSDDEFVGGGMVTMRQHQECSDKDTLILGGLAYSLDD